MARKRHGMYLSPTDDSQLVQELERCTVRGRKSDLLRNYALLGYQRAYAAWPSQPERAFNLAVSLEQLGQRDAAWQWYQHALSLTDAHSDPALLVQLRARLAVSEPGP